MLKPMVSIITPVYNRARLIKETLNSVQSQTFTDWEALVIDDNSTDGTRMCVEQESRNDPRIKLLIKETNAQRGANASRNLGLRAAEGELIVFLDSDDILLPHCLENRVEWMMANPACDLAVFPQTTFGEGRGSEGFLINVQTQEDDLNRFLRFGKDIDVPWLTSAPIWRRRFLDCHSLRWAENTPCYQDLFFHIEALARQPRYSFVNSQPDCGYRVHSGDRVGVSVHDPETVTKLVHRFEDLHNLLESHGFLSKDRKRLFGQSIYFSVILKLIDNERFSDAKSAICEFQKVGLFEPKLSGILKSYVVTRRVVMSSPRLRYYANRIFRKVTQRSIYFSSSSSYMTEKYEASAGTNI